jgi:hypothetical protein
MGLFAVQLPNTRDARTFLQLTDQRLQHKEITSMYEFPKLFIKGTVSIVHHDEESLIGVVRMDLLFPPLHLLLSLAMIVMGIIFAHYWVSWLGVLFGIPSVLWWTPVQYWLFKRGVKKQLGSDTRVRWLNRYQLCEVLDESR